MFSSKKKLYPEKSSINEKRDERFFSGDIKILLKTFEIHLLDFAISLSSDDWVIRHFATHGRHVSSTIQSMTCSPSLKSEPLRFLSLKHFPNFPMGDKIIPSTQLKSIDSIVSGSTVRTFQVEKDIK